MSEGVELSDRYDWDMDGSEEAIAEAEYRRRCNYAMLLGVADYSEHKKKKQNTTKIEDVFLIIQDSRKDDTTLMLVDRRKSKKYWWTHDFSLALKGNKSDMTKVAKKLQKNNVRLVEYNNYFNNK